jgi:hypothetical protein
VLGQERTAVEQTDQALELQVQVVAQMAVQVVEEYIASEEVPGIAVGPVVGVEYTAEAVGLEEQGRPSAWPSMLQSHSGWQKVAQEPVPERIVVEERTVVEEHTVAASCRKLKEV